MSTALVVVGDSAFSLLQSTGAELAEGLRQLGHTAELLRFPNAALAGERAFEEGFAQVCRRIQGCVDSGGDFFVVDMNAHLKYSQVRRTAMKRFCYITDAPWSQFDNIYSVGDDAVISYVDRHHAEFFARFPPGHRTVFMPHGGPQPDTDWHDDRPFPVLFLGNLTTPCRMEHFEALTAGLPEPVRHAAHLTLSLVLEEGLEPFKALSAALSSVSLGVESLGRSAFLDLLRFLCRFLESFNRHRVLTSLGKVKVTLAGSIAPGFFASAPANVESLGAVDEQAAMALMRRSRILLNSVTVFPGGSHERVWYGMAMGAAICTEPSTFLEETLSFGDHLLSLEDAVESGGASLAEALAAPTGVLPQARAALPLYAAAHTWRHRARIIHDAMVGKLTPS
ncbi:hypothetical protein A6A04_15900 [Paramagnetospirillum marisnigri]|uniref:Spore protein YkvP/CgeB glycosyl transferase-like domain-containing protein n=1 Tax=Paramagnetospirillum marisnigri TaxID=1285242 RepID=A0A178MSU5_9PROT|nr:glycosyltransferase [Paramagnetospirillum marisnigri]OAN51405.1 hypothetical protein A6A04_15900 [Paramagnetospirillum marisnigri]